LKRPEVETVRPEAAIKHTRSTRVSSSSPPGDGQVENRYLTGIAGLLVLVGVFLALLMGGMDALVVSTVLPNIAGDLHQVDGVTFVVSAYLISSTISIPVFARLSDITSRRNVFLGGLIIFIAGSALAGLSQNLDELIVFRGIQGFGGGGVFPVAIAMVGVLYSPAMRAKAVGFLTGSAGLSIVLGPLVGSYIVSVTTWRWVFYINLPFGVAAAAITLLAIGPLRPAASGRYDVVGSGLLAGWVGALMFALVQVADAGWAWTDPRTAALLLGAVLLLAGFLGWELRVHQPLVPLRLLGHRVIAASSGMMLFSGIVFSSAITFLSVFVGIVLLHQGPNASAQVRDIIYFFAIPMILGAALAGQILSRLSYRKIAIPGLVVAGVAAVLLTQLTPTIPLWVLAYGFLPVGGVALPLIPMGFGLGLSLVASQIAVLNEAPVQDVGAAVGLTRFFQSLGGALGISLLTVYATWRYQVLSSGAQSASAYTSALVGSYNEVFLLLACCILVSLGFAFFLVGKTRSTRPFEPSGTPELDVVVPPSPKSEG
jgi:EmrB/QacA subfamily drug resistance transporter